MAQINPLVIDSYLDIAEKPELHRHAATPYARLRPREIPRCGGRRSNAGATVLLALWRVSL